MSFRSLLAAATALACIAPTVYGQTPPANPAIDVEQHLLIAEDAARHRETRRVTEEQFIEMSRLPGTIVLDARSKQKYDELHVRGAMNLSFPDLSFESLAMQIPDKATTILIYCNNNFRGNESAFPRKAAGLSLNLSTYATLYGYGYRNIYELAPLIDVDESKLTLERSADVRAELREPAPATARRPRSLDGDR